MYHLKRNHGNWLFFLMVMLCVAMMGQVLFSEMHHHAGDHPSGDDGCWACFCGPWLALLVAAILVAPAQTGRLRIASAEHCRCTFLPLNEAPRGPPASS